MRKYQPKALGPKDEKVSTAVASLKEALVSPSVLVLSRNEVWLTLDADACHKQIGCVLLQEHHSGVNYLLATGLAL